MIYIYIYVERERDNVCVYMSIHIHIYIIIIYIYIYKDLLAACRGHLAQGVDHVPQGRETLVDVGALLQGVTLRAGARRALGARQVHEVDLGEVVVRRIRVVLARLSSLLFILLLVVVVILSCIQGVSWKCCCSPRSRRPRRLSLKYTWLISNWVHF